MPFRPHTLPYKLRKLFDAKVCSPQDLARSLGVPVSRVDAWLRGAEPDHVTRVQVDKVLSYYSRRARDRHLKLDKIEDAELRPQLMPGIVEVNDAPAGLVEVKVRNSKGDRIGFFQASAGDIDDEILDALIDWQQRRSARPNLAIAADSSLPPAS